MITQTVRQISIFTLTITMLAVLALASGCSSQTVQETAGRHSTAPVVRPGQSHRTSLGERAAAVALAQVGVPYRYGGATTSGFDCSGLVQFAYGRAGKNVPRTTGQLWSSSPTVPRSDIRIGDLLFFNIEGKMSHVGMYIGGQQFVHAPSSGRSVTVAKLTSPYYAAALLRAGRPK